MIHSATEEGDYSEKEGQEDEGQDETDDVLENEIDLPSSFVNDERTKARKRTSGTVILKRQNHASSSSSSECLIFYYRR